MFILYNLKFIEIPFRNKKIINNRKFISIYSVILFLILVLSYSIVSSNGVPKRFTSQELSLIDYKPKRGAIDYECRKADIKKPCIIGKKSGTQNLVLLGDSHAENLSSELNKILLEKNLSAKLLYKAGCPFIFNLERIHKFLNCSEHNQEVFNLLLKSNVSEVIINDRGGNYINGMPFDNYEGELSFR